MCNKMILGVLVGLIAIGFRSSLPINRACEHLPYDFHTIPGTREYFFLRYELRRADSARQYCNSMGMELASVNSAAQNQLIRNFMKQTNVDNGLFHTSGRILSNSTFVWTNGNAVSYTNFEQIRGFDPINNYVAINKTTGLWVTVSCDLIAGIICHVKC